MRAVLKNIGVILFSLLLHLYFYGLNSEHIQKLDYAAYDLTTIFNAKIQKQEESFYTVIVDIDEESLLALGQWPWPRVIIAQLIENIATMRPTAIGVNILFPEEDRVSPKYIQKFYKNYFGLKLNLEGFPSVLLDNDKYLGELLSQLNATLAIYFDNSRYVRDHCQELSYRHNMFGSVPTKFISSSLLCNHLPIQEAVKSFGFINAWSDSDEILRRIPLFMGYRDEVFPSFALATLLSVDQHRKVNYTEDSMLINFSKHKPKVFSAMDILTHQVPLEEIQGKMVILGSSVIGLDSKYTIANGEKISNNMIHAFAIDNLIANNFLTQPEYYKKINIVLSFLVSLMVIFLFQKRQYLNILGLIFMVFLLTSIWLLYSYRYGIYISIGYFWTPLVYFFLGTLIYHIHLINKEKEQQERLLIRQSKLASMGEMISLIAHQWRQPLSVINGIVINIDIDHRLEKLDRSVLDEHLNQIEETTAYLSKTINDFTDFFSKNKGKERFMVSDVIAQAIQLTGVSSQGRIEIEYRTSKDVEILGYKSELIQSILVVLNNAIHACQKQLPNIPNGQIIIQTQEIEDRLRISIEDNGGGIDPKDLEKIFDPYYTTKKQGTGLGLYILKLIIEESMSGRVFLVNGKLGAIFTIEIPLEI